MIREIQSESRDALTRKAEEKNAPGDGPKRSRDWFLDEEPEDAKPEPGATVPGPRRMRGSAGPEPSGIAATASRMGNSVWFASWLMVPLIVFLDQLSKNAVVERFSLWESLPVLGDLVRLTLVHNPGAAFGIMQNAPLLFACLTSGAIVFVTWHKLRTPDRSASYQLSLGLILSGAIGNLIDRFRYGYVIDFVDVGIGEMRWPAFNVADSAISIGVCLLIITSIFTSSTKDN